MTVKIIIDHKSHKSPHNVPDIFYKTQEETIEVLNKTSTKNENYIYSIDGDEFKIIFDENVIKILDLHQGDTSETKGYIFFDFKNRTLTISGTLNYLIVTRIFSYDKSDITLINRILKLVNSLLIDPKLVNSQIINKHILDHVKDKEDELISIIFSIFLLSNEHLEPIKLEDLPETQIKKIFNTIENMYYDDSVLFSKYFIGHYSLYFKYNLPELILLNKRIEIDNNCRTYIIFMTEDEIRNRLDEFDDYVENFDFMNMMFEALFSKIGTKVKRGSYVLDVIKDYLYLYDDKCIELWDENYKRMKGVLNESLL